MRVWALASCGTLVALAACTANKPASQELPGSPSAAGEDAPLTKQDASTSASALSKAAAQPKPEVGGTAARPASERSATDSQVRPSSQAQALLQQRLDQLRAKRSGTTLPQLEPGPSFSRATSRVTLPPVAVRPSLPNNRLAPPPAQPAARQAATPAAPSVAPQAAGSQAATAPTRPAPLSPASSYSVTPLETPASPRSAQPSFAAVNPGLTPNLAFSETAPDSLPLTVTPSEAPALTGRTPTTAPAPGSAASATALTAGSILNPTVSPAVDPTAGMPPHQSQVLAARPEGLLPQPPASTSGSGVSSRTGGHLSSGGSAAVSSASRGQTTLAVPTPGVAVVSGVTPSPQFSAPLSNVVAPVPAGPELPPLLQNQPTVAPESLPLNRVSLSALPANRLQSTACQQAVPQITERMARQNPEQNAEQSAEQSPNQISNQRAVVVSGEGLKSLSKADTCAGDTNELAQRIPDAATAGTPIPGRVESPTWYSPAIGVPQPGNTP